MFNWLTTKKVCSQMRLANSDILYRPIVYHSAVTNPSTKYHKLSIVSRLTHVFTEAQKPKIFCCP